MKIVDPYMRSSVYKALSELYQYPEPDRLQRLQSENKSLADLLETYAADTGLAEEKSISRLCGAIRTAKLEPMQVEYVRLFDYRPPCPPYQSSRVRMEQENPAQLYLLLEACYREFGLTTNPAFKDPPDHISMELEFMHFLAHKEGSAIEDGDLDTAEKYRSAQKAFAENHIMEWIPAFASSLKDHARTLFFKSLALVTGAFVTSDANYLSTFQPA